MRLSAKSFGLPAFPVLATIAAAACVGNSNKTSPSLDGGELAPAAGSSGAFGIVTVDGTQKLYLPASVAGANGNGFIAVVDVGVAGSGVAGAGALLSNIDLGTTDMATATGGNASIVLAASTSSPTVWFIDPAKDVIVSALQLDSATYGTSEFSGGGGYVTGIAIDSAHNQAILSVWNGFALVDLGSRTITKVIQAPPSENFGFDSVHGLILAPFYNCANASNAAGTGLSFCGSYKGTDGTVMTDGLNVITLSDDTVYTFEDATAASPDRDVDEPLGGEPDSASIDPTTQIAVVPSETEGSQNVLDLSKAIFSKATNTFTAPLRVIPDEGLEGVAIEPTSHYAFFENEHGNNVGLVNATQASAGSAPFYFAAMPSTPDGNDWENMGDPHGVAVTTTIAGGAAVGFVVSSDQHWVARIDLAKFAALGAAAGDDAGAPPIDVTAAVTYLDSTTARGGDAGLPASEDAGEDAGAAEDASDDTTATPLPDASDDAG